MAKYCFEYVNWEHCTSQLSWVLSIASIAMQRCLNHCCQCNASEAIVGPFCLRKIHCCSYIHCSYLYATSNVIPVSNHARAILVNFTGPVFSKSNVVAISIFFFFLMNSICHKTSSCTSCRHLCSLYEMTLANHKSHSTFCS
jgi:hypothetical protein